jgi:hypothetical protein
MMIMFGDCFRFGSAAQEWLLCKPVDVPVAALGEDLERIPPDVSMRHVERAFAERTPALRAFAQRVGIAGGTPMCRLGDARLRVLMLQLVATGALLVVVRKPPADTAPPAAADARVDRAQEDLVREFRYATRGSIHFEGQAYELMTGASLRDGRDLGDLRLLPRAQAQRVLAGAAATPTAHAELRRVLEKATPQLAADTSLPGAIAGLVLVRRLVSTQPILGEERPGPTVPAGRKVATDEHWVDFRFKDAAGRPLQNLEYRLALPDGRDVKGTLGGAGKVHEDGQPSGGAVIEIVDIDAAGWSVEEIGAHEQVQLQVQASKGFAPGEPVKIEIFRLYRERDDDAVARLEARLDSARQASVGWTPGSLDSPDDRFVFKASIRKAWRKSAPLAVRHRATAAAWSAPQASEGDTVTLRAALSGVADGESATLSVFEKQWRSGRSTLVDTLTAPVSAGAVETTWAVPAAQAPRRRGASGRRDFHYTVEAGGLHCTSTHVAVFPAQGGATQGAA